jgi:hypothetical protein
MMDRLDVLRAVSMGASAVAIAVAARFALGAPLRAPNALPPDDAMTPAGAMAARGNPDSLAALITRRDPFRMSREPGAVPFNPDAAADAPPPPRAPRPPLALAGIVLGAEPLALIDGLPGLEGSRVMRVGERAGDYVLRAITADRVVIAGPDTTWTLRVRSQYP